VTAPVHDVVVGTPGPTRNRAVATLIAGEQVRRTTESWLIDVYGTHPEQKAYRSLTAAREMLARLNTFRPNDRGQDLCITIEDASEVLKDPQIRANVEDILRGASTASIKFRLVVVNLDVSSFGGSKTIRDEVIAGNVIEVSRG